MNTNGNIYSAPGDITSTTAESFWQKIEPMVREMSPGSAVEFDLRAARTVDSVGLNMIVKAIRMADERSGRVRIRLGSESLRRLCRFTRLDEHAEILN